MHGGDDRELLKAVGGELFQQHKRVGMKLQAGHQCDE